MRDDDVEAKLAPGRTVRCRACRYDVPAAFQNADGSKTTADVGDVLKARGWWVVSALLSLSIQNVPVPHGVPCGRQCRGGAVEDGQQACPGVEECDVCKRMEREGRQS